MPFLPDKKEGDQLGASHINQLNAIARQLAAGVAGSNIDALGGVQVGRRHATIRVVVVTAVATETESTGSSDSSVSSASSSSSGSSSHTEPVLADDCIEDGASFQCQPLYYNHDDHEWLPDDEESDEFCLDASAFGDNLVVDDQLVAFWDDQRDMFVAIQGPPSSTPTASRNKAKWGKLLADAGKYQQVQVRVWTGLPGPSGPASATSEIVMGFVPGVILPAGAPVRLAVTDGFPTDVYDISPYECPDDDDLDESSDSSSPSSSSSSSP